MSRSKFSTPYPEHEAVIRFIRQWFPRATFNAIEREDGNRYVIRATVTGRTSSELVARRQLMDEAKRDNFGNYCIIVQASPPTW